uniref:Uncharacterized protein n=1 Tax=viral metagenome TaxID=1070528 RepID=A0A6M3KK04_9ZZZZ
MGTFKGQELLFLLFITAMIAYALFDHYTRTNELYRILGGF